MVGLVLESRSAEGIAEGGLGVAIVGDGEGKASVKGWVVCRSEGSEEGFAVRWFGLCLFCIPLRSPRLVSCAPR